MNSCYYYSQFDSI